MPTDFSIDAIEVMKSIPHGKVTTYGRVAELAGRPGAARAIVWLLHSSSKKYRIPWHRVVNARGRISFDRSSSSFVRQKRLLKKEGIEVDEYGAIDLAEYLWDTD